MVSVGAVVSSVGGAVVSVGAVVSSVGGAVVSVGAVVSSVGGAVVSVGAAVSSVGGAVVSVGTVESSTGGAVVSIGAVVANAVSVGSVVSSVVDAGWVVCVVGAVVAAVVLLVDSAVPPWLEQAAVQSSNTAQEIKAISLFLIIFSLSANRAGKGHGLTKNLDIVHFFTPKCQWAVMGVFRFQDNMIVKQPHAL